eukprot:1382445-Amorphochlora_amoeboformis.AAC.1
MTTTVIPIHVTRLDALDLTSRHSQKLVSCCSSRCRTGRKMLSTNMTKDLTTPNKTAIPLRRPCCSLSRKARNENTPRVKLPAPVNFQKLLHEVLYRRPPDVVVVIVALILAVGFVALVAPALLTAPLDAHHILGINRRKLRSTDRMATIACTATQKAYSPDLSPSEATVARIWSGTDRNIVAMPSKK